MNKLQAPILLHDIASEIRKKGSIWRIEKIEDGLLFRAEAGRVQFRIFIPRPDKFGIAQPPIEKTPCHVVSNITSLRNWLAEQLSSNLIPKN